jgi:hypothetical protein
LYQKQSEHAELRGVVWLWLVALLRHEY